MDGLSTPYRLLKGQCTAVIDIGDISTFGPSCTEFFDLLCWDFDSGAICKIDDVLIKHGGLPHVLPLAVHLIFFGW